MVLLIMCDHQSPPVNEIFSDDRIDRLTETAILVFTQRVQYVYSILAIGDPLVIVELDWYVFTAIVVKIDLLTSK